MAKWFGMVAITLVMAACSDGGTGPGEGRPTFTADAASYRPYGVATLQVTGGVPAQDVIVPGTLGTAPIEIMRSSDSTVSFLVPNVSGSLTVAFTVGTTSYSGPITVLATPAVTNAPAFLQTIADIADAQMDQAAATLAGEALPGDSAIALDMLDEARDSLASFRTRLAQLTPAEAQQVADFLNANLDDDTRAAIGGVQSGAIAASAVAIPVVCRQRPTALSKYTCTWVQLAEGLADVTISLGGAALAAKSSILSGPVGLTIAAFLAHQGIREGIETFKIGIELVKIHAYAGWFIVEPVIDFGLDQFRTHVLGNAEPGFALAGMSAVSSAGAAKPAEAAGTAQVASSSSMTRLVNGRTVAFTFSPRFRPVQLTDRSAPLTWLSPALNLVSRYNTLVGRFKESYRIKFATPTMSFPTTVPHTEVKVEIVGNSKVKVGSLTGVDDRIEVTFTSTETTIQDFKYDIVYTSGAYPAVRVRHTAKLHPPSYTIAWSDTTELADTVTVFTHIWRYDLLLLDPEGSVVNDQLTRDVWVDDDTSSDNADIGIQYYSNGYMPMTASLRDTTRGLIDTATVTILMNAHPLASAPIRTLTFIVIDSLTTYRRSVPGRWQHTYGNYRNVYQFNADRSASMISSVYIPTGAPVTPSALAYEWYIEGGMTAARKPIFALRWKVRGTNYTGDPGGIVTYPVRAWDNGPADRGVKLQ